MARSRVEVTAIPTPWRAMIQSQRTTFALGSGAARIQAQSAYCLMKGGVGTVGILNLS
jgi:hypothetical protein